MDIPKLYLIARQNTTNFSTQEDNPQIHDIKTPSRGFWPLLRFYFSDLHRSSKHTVLLYSILTMHIPSFMALFHPPQAECRAQWRKLAHWRLPECPKKRTILFPPCVIGVISDGSPKRQQCN